MKNIGAVLIGSILLVGTAATQELSNLGGTVPETKEHQFARIQYEPAAQWYDANSKQLRDILDALDRDHKERVGFGLDWREKQLQICNRIHAAMKASQPRIELLKVRLQHADECTNVYLNTIDIKASDLTMRQQEAVRACQGIGQYPPER